jgi:cyclopropane fatty-acyl-phospholipid synthase-like methyltransferase
MPVGTTNTRDLDRDDARQLRPGDDHYLAYIGPPKQYDYMGATQVRLLTTLGLRESHRVLDLGCGSLRAGRLLIPYLLPDCYHGIEPNAWLVDEAIEHQLGRDILRVKRPRFDANNEFRTDVFGVEFDFIVAQSIFSHATPGLVVTALTNMRDTLAANGLVACTFVEAPAGDSANFAEGWVYPDCVRYTAAEVATLFERAGLSARRIPWFHPRQAWYLGALDAAQLPADDELHELGGAVLRDPEFRNSIVR